MRAIEIVNHEGPLAATQLVDLPDPTRHPISQESGVVIRVAAAGVSFPEVLQTRGQYQINPPLPFVPGSEVSGTVISAPAGSQFQAGDAVMAFCMLGGFAEVAIAAPHLTFPLRPGLTFAEGAGFILNYHTAYFALTTRGRLSKGETVVVHGAGGGIGTAAIQIAKALDAQVIGVVSSSDRAEAARIAGADDVVLRAENWNSELRNAGADLVIDPVGGADLVDGLRILRRGGRLVVVGFAAGKIPIVRVNRLLLTNTEVTGAGYGAWLEADPQLAQRIGEELLSLSARHELRPIVGHQFPLDRVAEALGQIDERRAVGKVVLDVGRGGGQST